MKPLQLSVLVILGGLLVAGCGSGERPADPAPADTTSAPDTTTFAGTTAPVEQARPEVATATLAEVRSARHEEFDRVVFVFEGALPGYQVRYVEEPMQCGSGRAVEVAGAGYLEVRFSPAQAHTDAGEPTVQERERALSLPVISELEATCDFEGYVTWILGLAEQVPYRVLEEAEPSRFVVDVQHLSE